MNQTDHLTLEIVDVFDEGNCTVDVAMKCSENLDNFGLQVGASVDVVKKYFENLDNFGVPVDTGAKLDTDFVRKVDTVLYEEMDSLKDVFEEQ